MLPRLIVLVGLPGAGKSTYARQYGLPVLSSDALRLLLADDERDQTLHGRVFGALRYLVRQRLELRRPVTCVDATNLTRRERRPWIRLGELHDGLVEAVYLDVSVELCLERNRTRARVVPDDVIRAMAARLVVPSRDEGFTQVTVVPGISEGTS